MKTICELTDKNVLGLEGRSHALPRRTARAILKNDTDLYAVMYAKKFDLYSLPGGGIEGQEDIHTALRREILEETGCTCDEIQELGIVLENRAHCDYTQESYYFVVTTHHVPQRPALTEAEAENGTCLFWMPLEEAVGRIVSPVHTTNQRKFLQARDKAALNAFLKRT